MKYESVIGLEVHVQLNTASKIFCSCPTTFGGEPNTHTCPVCQGQPGVLPVLNRDALKKIVLAGLSLNSKIAEYSKFDRKNYFYPDLPKAYQISQYDRPVCEGGHVDISTKDGSRQIALTRIHLEEDAGKLIHSEIAGRNESYVDLNRAGVPLAEIVSEPDMRSADEAYEYLQSLKTTMKYIGVSDVNMEEGSLRCDVNISIREFGDEKLGEKVEIKNLNSFKAVRSAINYEIERQTDLAESGRKADIVQETRLWDADSMVTYSMRSKENAHDYRYFPDPDLPPVVITGDFIEEIRASLPELPAPRKARFIEQYALPEADADILISSRQLADYYEECISAGAAPKRSANWILSELLARIPDADAVTKFNVSAASLAELLILIDNNTINGKTAKQVFNEMCETGKKAPAIVEEKGLKQVTDSGEIEELIIKIIEANPASVQDYKNGKEKAIGFLVGQVMKESRGKANPQIVNSLMAEKLKSL